MDNVFVMAGVPKIMNAMMDVIAPRLARGVPMQSRTVEFRGGEGDAAKPLGDIQKRFPSVVIGSYPFQTPDGFAANLVLRSRDAAALDAAHAEVVAMAKQLTAEGKARGWS
jgi:molybdopterin-biosynthesis enzyme MoeA-like protein